MRRFSLRRGVFAAALILVSSTTAVPHVDAADLQVPNLQSKTPFDLYLSYADEGDFTNPYEMLRFTMATSNVGDYALDVLGAEPKNTEATVASQCVAWHETLPKVCTERRAVGEFTFHALHRHWHFNNFAVYELRKLTRKGDIDMSPSGLLSTSPKISFCLEDTHRNDPQDPDTQLAFYRGCAGVYQGISAGWSDHYPGELPGQQLRVDTVPDGTYALVVKTNPSNILLETDYSDNTASQKIRLTTSTNTSCTTTRAVEPVA